MTAGTDDRVRRIASGLNIELAENDSGKDEGALDSIALLELIVALEAEFDVNLMDEELDAPERLRSIGSIVHLIEERLGR